MTESNPASISILIVSSFDPLFLECNNITRKQSKQYGVPVMFLFNGKIPEGYQLQPDEYLLETDSTDAQPYMFLKFKYALQYIFNSGSNPDYILRCNATTFINFKAFILLSLYLHGIHTVISIFTGDSYSNIYIYRGFIQ